MGVYCSSRKRVRPAAAFLIEVERENLRQLSASPASSDFPGPRAPLDEVEPNDESQTEVSTTN